MFRQSVVTHLTIDHFKVVYLVALPLNESEAAVDLVLIQTSLLFFCKFLLIGMITASLIQQKQGGFYQGQHQPHFHSKAGHLSTYCKIAYYMQWWKLCKQQSCNLDFCRFYLFFV